MYELAIVVAQEVTSRVKLDRDEVRIGRDQSMEVWLPDPTLSKHHATIRREGSAYVLHDQASTNGTFVNEARIESRALNDGDRIEVGGYTLVFEHRLPAWMRAAPAPVEPRLPQDGLVHTYALEPERERAARERTVGQIAELALVNKTGANVVVDRDVFLVGRGEPCGLRPSDPHAPRVAAVILRGQGGWQIAPTGGVVLIGDQRLAERAWLREGDKVTVHDVAFTFRVRGREATRTGLKRQEAPVS